MTLRLYIKKAREQIEPFSCLMQMNKFKKCKVLMYIFIHILKR